MKLIFRGFSFRINFYILCTMMIFTTTYSLVIESALKSLFLILFLACALTSIGPGLIGTARKFWIIVFIFIFRQQSDAGQIYAEMLEEIKKLCTKMGMANIKERVKLKIVPSWKNAAVSGNTIYVGKPLIDRLNSDEIKFIFAHELAHIKLKQINEERHGFKNHNYIFRLIDAVILVALVYLYLISILSLLTFWISVVVIIIISIRFFSWPNEYEADFIAYQHIDNTKAANSALAKLAEMTKMDVQWSYYSHPCISNRIANFDWSEKERRKKWHWSLS